MQQTFVVQNEFLRRLPQYMICSHICFNILRKTTVHYLWFFCTSHDAHLLLFRTVSEIVCSFSCGLTILHDFLYYYYCTSFHYYLFSPLAASCIFSMHLSYMIFAGSPDIFLSASCLCFWHLVWFLLAFLTSSLLLTCFSDAFLFAFCLLSWTSPYLN